MFLQIDKRTGPLHLLIKLAGALGIVAGSFFLTLWVMDYISVSCSSRAAVALARPFQKFSMPGFGYVKDLPRIVSAGDVPDAPNRSNLMVCENGKILGPMHAAHGEIAKDGRGRYSHWGTSLVFSTSDNTDPNTNGREYSVVPRR